MSSVETELLRLATQFRLRRSDNQHPTSLQDVLQIIGDRGWYRHDTANKRHIIYMLAYGIFRDRHNDWATTAATEWMRTWHTCYQPYTVDIADRRQHHNGKGFVYSLIVKRASNKFSKGFAHTMNNMHGEFLAVKMSPTSTHTYTSLHYGSNVYYLDTSDSTHTRTLQNVRQAVQASIRCNVSVDVILQTLQVELASQRNNTVPVTGVGCVASLQGMM